MPEHGEGMKNMSVQVTDEMHERISALAQAAGLSRSEYIRRCIRISENRLSEIRDLGEAEGRKRWHH